jgi:hypothetical protein
MPNKLIPMKKAAIVIVVIVRMGIMMKKKIVMTRSLLHHLEGITNQYTNRLKLE